MSGLIVKQRSPRYNNLLLWLVYLILVHSTFYNIVYRINMDIELRPVSYMSKHRTAYFPNFVNCQEYKIGKLPKKTCICDIQ